MSKSVMAVYVEVETGEARATGKQKGPKAKQEAWADLGGRYPVKVTIALWDDDAPLAAGRYLVGLDSLGTNRFGDLEFRLRPQQMKPVKAAA